MLSDFPHKYEEYRTHQRERQLAEPESVPEPIVEEVKVEEPIKAEKSDVRTESKTTEKSEPPEKTRQVSMTEAFVL